jgi:hypothetical protein
MGFWPSTTPGAPQWAVPISSFGDDAGMGVTVDALGNAYVTGYFRGAVRLGAYNLSGSGVSSGFVARYSPQGVCEWAQSMTEPGGVGYSVAVRASGDVVVSGAYYGLPVQFGSTTLQPTGANENSFVAKINPATST